MGVVSTAVEFAKRTLTPDDFVKMASSMTEAEPTEKHRAVHWLLYQAMGENMTRDSDKDQAPLRPQAAALRLRQVVDSFFGAWEEHEGIMQRTVYSDGEAQRVQSILMGMVGCYLGVMAPQQDVPAVSAPQIRTVEDGTVTNYVVTMPEALFKLIKDSETKCLQPQEQGRAK